MEERAEGSSNQMMKGEEVTMTSFLCIDMVPTVRGVCMQGCVRHTLYMYGMKYNTVTEECTLLSLSVTCNN